MGPLFASRGRITGPDLALLVPGRCKDKSVNVTEPVPDVPAGTAGTHNLCPEASLRHIRPGDDRELTELTHRGVGAGDSEGKPPPAGLDLIPGLSYHP